ncbi:gas vesicle protein [Streptomyces chattanoogensis]|uniref:Gas vesicle protein n=1 Tax=Streptomyces chattanoogensis TaxID=66876 RepID=A0A0N0GXC1_9ACTN|nr:gas vesicle protein [Streptomyces chattanoogensis]KPC60822.1 gas vesicle protein [Streptomyces chattanoogensis]
MRAAGGPTAATDEPLPDRQIALIDLLDRLLSGGVVLTGDVVLSIADIDLVRVSLRALIVAISEENPGPWPAIAPPENTPARDRHDT